MVRNSSPFGVLLSAGLAAFASFRQKPNSMDEIWEEKQAFQFQAKQTK